VAATRTIGGTEDREDEMPQPEALKGQGHRAVLQGRAACCDGVLKRLESTDVDAEVIRKLEQARDLCRSLGDGAELISVPKVADRRCRRRFD
jgi:hypothetical protein